jgi:hypothetical protein
MTSILRFLLAASIVLGLSGVARADTGKPDEAAAMKLSHVRILVGHAVGMVTEGSNLIMNAGMKMSPGYDEMNTQRGLANFKNSKSLVQGALSGDEMIAMHTMGLEDDPRMKEIHKLGNLILKYITIVERMHVELMDQGTMDMHHMHLMTNHAMNRAADGSNLVTLGGMSMAGDLDKFTVAHGRIMINDAGPILDSVISGQAMKELHATGRGPSEDLFMYETHQLIETAYHIIERLEKM